MTYRFIRVTTLYPQYIQLYYDNNPEAHLNSYVQQYSDIASHSIELVTSFGRCFRELGVDAFEIITNDPVLQQTWAKENNLAANLSEDEIVFSQLKFYKPDIIWIDSTSLMNKKWIKELRNEIPSLKLLVGHMCAPYNEVIGQSFPLFDIMFTCSPCTVKEFKAAGVNPYLLYHSFDQQVLETLKDIENPFPENDFVFTGSLLTGYGLHKTRIEYLENFLKNKIDLRIYGNVESRNTIHLKQIMHYAIKGLKNIGLDKFVDTNQFLKKYKHYGDEKVLNYSGALIKAVNPPVFGLDMYQLLQKSKLCFNIHGDIAKRCAGNIRLFEATGIGTCLVTDWKENMKDLFDLDNEIIIYKSLEECIEKVKWLIANPKEAKKITLAGQKRTLKDHSVQQRTIELNELFINKLKK